MSDGLKKLRAVEGMMNRESAIRVLLYPSSPNAPRVRLAAWLACLHLTSDSRRASDLRNSYTALCGLPVPRELSPAESELLECDLVRSVNWFESLYPAHITSEESVQKATHVFRLLILHHDFAYYQGADRFLWICYIVALAGSSTVEEADALAFHLTKATLDVAAAHGFPKTRELEPQLRILDGEIEREAPEVAAGLATYRHTAFHYASRWVLLWFADEHDLPGILAIWDNVIGVIGRNPRDLRKYLYALAVAHAVAVPVPRDGVPMLQAIQQHRQWNIAEILERAKPKGWCSENRYLVAVAVVVAVVVLCYIGNRCWKAEYFQKEGANLLQKWG
jgi:hypothetical protein